MMHSYRNSWAVSSGGGARNLRRHGRHGCNGRWNKSLTSTDPLAEAYYHVSPYAYCAGNPVSYVDPDGMGINDVNELEGATIVGERKKWYVMDKSWYEWKKNNQREQERTSKVSEKNEPGGAPANPNKPKTTKKQNGKNAKKTTEERRKNSQIVRKIRQWIKKRIEKDGKLSFEEAFVWWKIGGGESLTVDQSAMALDFVEVPADLPINETFPINTFEGDWSQAIVYGTITGKKTGEGVFSLDWDDYNFDIHNNPNHDSFTSRRNFLTKIAAILHGEGTEFRIFFR